MQQLIEYIKGYEAYGVFVPKKPNECPQLDQKLVGKVGLLGIPFLASASLKQGDGYFLTAHSENYDNLVSSVQDAQKAQKPVACTQALYQKLQEKEGLSLEDAPEAWGLFMDTDGNWVPFNDPFEMSREELNRFRNGFTAQWGIELDAPCYVSMHLYRKGDEKIQVIENFNDEEIRVKLNYTEPASRKIGLALPDASSASMVNVGTNTLEMTLKPRSLVLVLSE